MNGYLVTKGDRISLVVHLLRYHTFCLLVSVSGRSALDSSCGQHFPLYHMDFGIKGGGEPLVNYLC